MMRITDYENTIYAGVLGKIIGVFLGRPVEGWSFEQIDSAFGEINTYKSSQVGAPLIVPDDDISGTFAFVRALGDNGCRGDLSSAQIGDGWLNYIIENKTILWWGGLCRSAEHTAYLRLKNGIHAPESGSIAQNGRSMAEQVGAEIFVDSWALISPDDPDQAVDLARKAASVSHDGIAVEAACYLAAMEAMAFSEKRLDVLMERARGYIMDETLLALIDEVTDRCKAADDWHQVRDWIEAEHGYDRYPGNCPMVTNHLVVLMALLMGVDDFQKSVSIACSAGWDTDCNAGNVGCLNGIRLGLSGIDEGIDLRTPIADRFYVVTSDGGSCITDAVIETKKLASMAAALRGEPCYEDSPRYDFSYPGSLQGFHLYEEAGLEQAMISLENAFDSLGIAGLKLNYRHLARGSKAAVCVETFLDMKPTGKEGTSYYEVLASPVLYSTQTVKALFLSAGNENPDIRLFVEYYDEKDSLARTESRLFPIGKGETKVEWEIPDFKGHPIYRLGIELLSNKRLDGSVILKRMDFGGAPKSFGMVKSMELTPALTPWTIDTTWLKSFVSSAEQFYPDYTTTFSISHPGPGGVATIGTLNWKDYGVTSVLTFAKQKAGGLILRAKGHRQYYGAVLTEGYAVILKQTGGKTDILARVPFPDCTDKIHELYFQAKGCRLYFAVDGRCVAEASDSAYLSGGAGFLIDTGAMLADGFKITAI